MLLFNSFTTKIFLQTNGNLISASGTNGTKFASLQDTMDMKCNDIWGLWLNFRKNRNNFILKYKD